MLWPIHLLLITMMMAGLSLLTGLIKKGEYLKFFSELGLYKKC